MKTLSLINSWEKDYVTMHYSPEDNLVWNEWRGVIPSAKLRDAVVYTCQFILDHEVSLLLSDYSRMSAPTLNDQVWVSNHSATLLQNSRLRKVANLMAQDLFQQIALDKIYDQALEVPLACESRDFSSKDDALEWLLRAY